MFLCLLNIFLYGCMKKKLDVCNFFMNSIWLKFCSMLNIFLYVLVFVKFGYDIYVYRVNLKL